MSFLDLLLPILLSTGLVFVASSMIHMVLQLHKADYAAFSNEEQVRAAINAGNPAPGQFILPHCTDPKQAAEPEMMKKFEEGPVAVLYIKPPGQIQLGPFLFKWIAYTAVLSAIAGYVAWAVLPAGASYLEVFRVVGTAAWLGYAWQGPSDSIWKGQPWRITLRAMGDGLVYALVTAASFAWLWPS
jgi:hypothetical protein